ncbi:peptidoglycan DD-metalloendopeptidase family protein [uncultured Amphritea sp.]|uniref:peptidoglycan DD-metalloendopeptidase family protein n=1 Tax=uncultured Amphritea sp. TaxID=981605 RepID=UPI00261073F3|nr:peptidoglycan DD-metalloendopeptidase family protein [uncultured Amphritea sp.]
MLRAVADLLKAPVFIVGVLMLSACSSTSVYSPVDERSISGRHAVKIVSSQTRSDPYKPGHYKVRRGDTLYSIAFRYGLDFRQLARSNGISDRYEIYPGQTLALKETPPPPRSQQSAPVAKPAKSTIATKPATQKIPAAVKRPVPTPPANAKTKPVTPPLIAKKPPAAVAERTLEWRWPVTGKVIQGFSDKGVVNKGINLAGSKGEPVFAAESGKVVYAGSGLLGYGNLVIIHHNEKFLSAYAHNSRILVKENDKVKTGDKIAEIGNSGAARTMLHFEIRRDGQPVDPMMYLPRKR